MPYHHGNLRETLIDAAISLARTGGPDEVVLRAAARVAGVSHNAAYRHFEDRNDLLRAVCERCMSQLAELIEQRISELPTVGEPRRAARDRLNATGRAYIEFALQEPGWFRTAFGVPREVVPLDPGTGPGPGGRSPYELLGDALDELVAVGELTPARRERAEYPAWSAVHGISTLLTDGPLRGLPDAERDAAIDKVLAVVDAGL